MLCLSSEDGQLLAVEARERFGLDIISIELVRISGKGFTSIRTLSVIEQIIADAFKSNPTSVLFYYCDFLNPIPSTSKTIPPQEYRSRLFSLMCQRYLSSHGIHDISEVIIEVDGLDEPYFFHMICRNEHLPRVQHLAAHLKEGFEK